MKLANIDMKPTGKLSIRLVPETSVDKNLLELLKSGDYQPDGMHYDRENTQYGMAYSNQERTITALVIYFSPDGSDE